jgi:hypothetical protein
MLEQHSGSTVQQFGLDPLRVWQVLKVHKVPKGVKEHKVQQVLKAPQVLKGL